MSLRLEKKKPTHLIHYADNTFSFIADQSFGEATTLPENAIKNLTLFSIESRR